MVKLRTSVSTYSGVSSQFPTLPIEFQSFGGWILLGTTANNIRKFIKLLFQVSEGFLSESGLAPQLLAVSPVTDENDSQADPNLECQGPYLPLEMYVVET